jgi:hypothetical protein
MAISCRQFAPWYRFFILSEKNHSMHIGILGGGPSGLFMYKRLLESGMHALTVTIFEKNERLGAGMPYSTEGANDEHVTNVSGNEIPELVTPVIEWIKTASPELLKRFNMVPEKFNDYKVVPRLLFGEYLSDQFDLLIQHAKKAGIETEVLLNTEVTDIINDAERVKVVTNNGDHSFDAVVITTGHRWPKKNEEKTPGYFDSPYPPSKLVLKTNYPVAIRGASLTAMDAVRTFARDNGKFLQDDDGNVSYQLSEDCPEFRLVLHSIDGLLPGIRFHLEDPQLSREEVISEEELWKLKEANDGFVPLDYIFERNFKQPLRKQHPEFYEQIKDLSIEQFVDHVMSLRERLDPIVLFKAEYAEAEKSIRRRQSVYWKEMLASLSFAMNYPAKHFSAEDMMRLKKVLMPLISIVIAFVPQSSCKEFLALNDAGVLSVVAVDKESKVIPQEQGGALYIHKDEQGKEVKVHYNLFVDCIGQPHLHYHDFPFKSLRESGTVSAARLKFRSAEEGAKAMNDESLKVDLDSTGDYYLHVPGITINDNFQVLDKYGAYSDRIYIMAVPYIGGYNPDYSGLDFSAAASERIVAHLSTLSSLK